MCRTFGCTENKNDLLRYFLSMDDITYAKNNSMKITISAEKNKVVSMSETLTVSRDIRFSLISPTVHSQLEFHLFFWHHNKDVF